MCTLFLCNMKNVTLSADEGLIEKARACALERKSTLNALFRLWLSDLVKQREAEERLKELDLRLGYVRSGGNFTRDQMNER